MQLDKAIKSRHSVRKFSTKKVNWRDIITAIDHARLAPLAGNIPTLKFMVISDKTKIQQISEACQQSLQEGGITVSLEVDKPAFYVHETSVVDKSCRIGKGTKIWHFCHLMPDVTVGERCVLGQNTFVGTSVSIGNNVKIQNNVSVYEGVVLEDDVFCGPSCVFTNVINPRAHVSRNDSFLTTLVKRGATIGANATVLCGLTIGNFAFVSAGSVVTQDVPDYALVCGNPARLKGWRCQCGEKLSFNEGNEATCPACGFKYEMDTSNNEVVIRSKGKKHHASAAG